MNTKPLPVVIFLLFLSAVELVFQLNFQKCAWLCWCSFCRNW
jgi:hypothetical protein